MSSDNNCLVLAIKDSKLIALMPASNIFLGVNETHAYAKKFKMQLQCSPIRFPFKVPIDIHNKEEEDVIVSIYLVNNAENLPNADGLVWGDPHERSVKKGTTFKEGLMLLKSLGFIDSLGASNIDDAV